MRVHHTGPNLDVPGVLAMNSIMTGPRGRPAILTSASKLMREPLPAGSTVMRTSILSYRVVRRNLVLNHR